MEILVCVKRVPAIGGAITLTADGQAVDTRMSGFTISPHEECAVEEAVRLAEQHGGSVTVITLGPAEAEEQLRACLAVGAHRAILLEASGAEPGPVQTAAALAAAALAEGPDLILAGNEAADTGDYQVGIRIAHELGRPVATGVKGLRAWAEAPGGAVAGSRPRWWLEARREYRGSTETFRLPLPAVVTVKEGINLPRYPSLPGRLRARRAVIKRVGVTPGPEGLRTTGLRVPPASRESATVLGHGADAVPELVRVLGELGVIS